MERIIIKKKRNMVYRRRSEKHQLPGANSEMVNSLKWLRRWGEKTSRLRGEIGKIKEKKDVLNVEERVTSSVGESERRYNIALKF